MGRRREGRRRRTRSATPRSAATRRCPRPGFGHIDVGDPDGPQWRTWEDLASIVEQPWYGFGGAWGRVGKVRDSTGPLGPGAHWKHAAPRPAQARVTEELRGILEAKPATRVAEVIARMKQIVAALSLRDLRTFTTLYLAVTEAVDARQARAPSCRRLRVARCRLREPLFAARDALLEAGSPRRRRLETSSRAAPSSSHSPG